MTRVGPHRHRKKKKITLIPAVKKVVCFSYSRHFTLYVGQDNFNHITVPVKRKQATKRNTVDLSGT